uniref:Nucleotidyltransferase n=1 Tax=Zooxanthella nutricula TaxID=1333877 RepID=A0A7S2L158_9DINO
MGLRLRPPVSADEARNALDEARARHGELKQQLEAARVAGFLPAEVDAGALNAWLLTVRTRQAAATLATRASAPSSPPQLSRGVSARSSGHDDVEAVQHILEEVERSEGIRIVHAGYAPSSRTLGTQHDCSDHDVHVIFVLHRSAYFGLHEPMHKFRRSFPAEGNMAQVDVSGWEVRHACRLLAQSNPSVLHMLFAPVEFKATQWTNRLREASSHSVDISALALAWWKHGRQNFLDFIKKREEPIRKKYVHVIRPLLCLQWMLRARTFVHDVESRTNQGVGVELPPAHMLDLCRGVAERSGLSRDEAAQIEDLVARRDWLPCPLPPEQSLNALVERLLHDGQAMLAERGVSVSARAFPQDVSDVESRAAQWHRLCVALVDDMSAFSLEGSKPCRS